MAGRPKKSFSDKEVATIELLAYQGCQNGTIANITGIAFKTLVRHFAKNMTKKRCERKQWLRKCQNKQAENSADMCKFLGTNELGQQVKQVIKTEVAKSDVPEAQKPAYKEAARVLKIRLAETGT